MVGRTLQYTISTVSVGTISSGNNANWSHTVPSGTNRGLAVLIGTHQGTITAVTFGGVALTKIAEGASAFNECGDIWLLTNPTVSTATIAVTMSSGSWWGGVGINLTNLKQTYTVTSATAGGAGTTASVSITPPSTYNLILAAVGSEATPSAGTGFTVAKVLQGQSFENEGSEYQQVSTKAQLSATFGLNSSQRWGIAAAAFEPASITYTTNRVLSGTRPIAGTRTAAF